LRSKTFHPSITRISPRTDSKSQTYRIHQSADASVVVADGVLHLTWEIVMMMLSKMAVAVGKNEKIKKKKMSIRYKTVPN